MLQPELKFRRDKIRSLMALQGIDAALITCNTNLIYTYGCVVSGYLYLPLHSPALLFFKRPNNITGEHSFPIRKPEQIVDLLKENGLPMPTKLMLEGDELPYTEYCRLASLFPETEVVNGTPLIRQARSVKTPVEIEMLRRSGIAHAKAYEQIPSVYRPGMTDIEFSIEIERLMRLQGCLGIFRVFGRSMEIFMGSVLTGDNAGYPSPYDFALGGQGLDPALPGGANKTPLKEGQSVMVDLGGNFNGYMGDMSRVFSIGKLPEEAYAAHQVCLDIQEKIASIARPGVSCEQLYDTAIQIATEAGFRDKFMGTNQQAKFIGHGIGLEINEAPVLAPRMKQELEPDMVFALEPKIVLPGVGPVGIENSWVVTNEGIELTGQFYAIDTKDWGLDFDANIAFNRNRIGGLTADQYANNLWYSAKEVFIQRNGLPIGAILGYVEDGFYDNLAEVRADPLYANVSDVEAQRMVGEIKYLDVNGDGKLTTEDRAIIGDTNPDFTYGLTGNFRWKNLTLSLFFQGTYGNDIFNANLTNISMQSVSNIPKFAYESRWTPDNTENAKWPRATMAQTREWRISDRHVEDGSYLKLKTINLAYNFGSPCKGIENLTVFGTVNNVFTITGYSWYDPDVNTFGQDASRRGVDIYSYPASRTFSLGVKVTL